MEKRAFIYSLPYISEAYLDEAYKNILAEQIEELGEGVEESLTYSQKNRCSSKKRIIGSRV